MIDTRFELIKQEFVDRTTERDRFNSIAGRKNSQSIFCLQAEDGWGKTWLLSRFYLDIPDDDCIKAMIDLGSTTVKDDQALLETIAEELSDATFDEMRAFVKAPLHNIQVQAGGNVQISGDLIAGNKTEVYYNGESDHFAVEVRDVNSRDQRVRNLTRLFRAAVNGLPASKPVVLIFDQFEWATESTRNWLVDQLFTGIKNGDFTNLIVVVAGAKPFDIFSGREWKYTVVQQQLMGLPEDSIREYWLQRRNLSKLHLDAILIILRSKGNSPFELSGLADTFERSS